MITADLAQGALVGVDEDTAVLAKINPIVRDGRTTTGEQRGPGPSRPWTFAALDHYLWQLTYKWACYSHQNKPKTWIVPRYYGRFNPASQDRWIFGNRDSGSGSARTRSPVIRSST
ncbi:hypothetical protein AB0H83_51820 [Dactylosporangium sp. NPDC050688]|uniref:hypothetical protein n=1 Tax=Dactylosporangium sp. NPDC050688 TaxID=3157217 RepID=UPI0033C7762C